MGGANGISSEEKKAIYGDHGLSKEGGGAAPSGNTPPEQTRLYADIPKDFEEVIRYRGKDEDDGTIQKHCFIAYVQIVQQSMPKDELKKVAGFLTQNNTKCCYDVMAEGLSAVQADSRAKIYLANFRDSRLQLKSQTYRRIAGQGRLRICKRPLPAS